MPSIKRAVCQFAILYLGTAAIAAAQGICLPPALTERAPPPSSETDSDFIEIEAGSIAVQSNSATEFSEGIRFSSHQGQISAETASYDPENASIDVIGRVAFEGEDFVVAAEDAAFNRDTEELSFSSAGFNLPKRPARGSAEQIVIRQANTMSLANLNFTTCPEDDVDWELLARELELDAEAGFGTARGVKLKFKGVPILYAPYFTFPIDDQRKSGFLTPHIAERDRTGLDVGIPYYLNLAPNYDLTLEPRYMSKRGVQISSDFRYLMPRSNGEFSFELLPNDDELANQTRRYVNLQHETNFGRNWQVVAGLEEVSDVAYFEDLGDSLSVTSLTHLNRFININYFAPRWSVQTRLQNYQTIDSLIADIDRPYERAPQVLFEGRWGQGLVGFHSETELVNFDRNVGTTGWRFDSTQEVSLRFARAGMYLTPAVAFRNTNYELDNVAPGLQDHFSRSLPISSIDAGFRFERTGGQNDSWIQTLEPRVLFVSIPFEDQSQLPVFDTILPDFNLVQLFRKYQFVGPDRIADTDQVSYGLTTRLLDRASGREKVSATFGRTQYRSLQQVVLPDAATNGRREDYVAELAIDLGGNWNLEMGYQWNGETTRTARAETRFQYRPQSDRLFGLGYRQRKGRLEQGDLSMVWPVGKNWRFIGQYSYSLLEKEPLEQFVGLEYEACCWRLRLISRSYIIRSTGQTDNTLSVQLELKGLSQQVSSPEELLDRGILGYRSLGGQQAL